MANPSRSYGDAAGPIQIISFQPTKVDGKVVPMLELDKKALQGVLQQVADLPVCLISVAGEARQGKSFLLCFLLRCLVNSNLEERGNGWMQWDDDQAPLEGFSWRNGVERETAGFWIWSSPFIIKKGDGSKVAVLLMDTQGNFYFLITDSIISTSLRAYVFANLGRSVCL